MFKLLTKEACEPVKGQRGYLIFPQKGFRTSVDPGERAIIDTGIQVTWPKGTIALLLNLNGREGVISTEDPMPKDDVLVVTLFNTGRNSHNIGNAPIAELVFVKVESEAPAK